MKQVDFETVLQKYPSSEREGLIPVLQELQNGSGYISEEIVVKVAAYFKLPTSKVFGLATFYDEFKFVPSGRYIIKVCNGSACHILGSDTLIRQLEKKLEIKAGETTRDGMFTLLKVNCLGACALAPVVMINNEYYTNFDEEELNTIIDECKKT